MLAWALASCPLMSRPNEWFNTDMLSDAERRLLLTAPPRYAQSLADLGYGRRLLVKVHYDDLENVVASWGRLAHPSASETIGLAVQILTAMVPAPRIVFLSREDKLRQGISLWRARMTGEWEAYRRDEGPELDTTRLSTELRADQVEEILTTSENLVEQEAGWASVFQRAEIPYLQMTYEQLVQTWDSATKRMWAWLSLRCSRPEPITAKQSDEWSDAVANRLRDSWAARLRAVGARIEPFPGA